MHPRNAYLILGISPRASQEAIRAAYRELARRYHPDRAGPSGAARFHEATEAYRVLSDPESRRAHNRELGLSSESPSAEPLTSARWPAAEPLAAEPFSLRVSLHAAHPFLEEAFLHWTRRHFTDRHLARSGRRQPMDMELVLSRWQAVRGGVLPIEIPSFSVCERCGGHGREWFSHCAACGGEGTVEELLVLPLRVPAGIRDGMVWEVVLPQAGLDLRVFIRVDPFS